MDAVAQIQSAVNTAYQLWKGGNHAEAAKIYQQLVTAYPKEPDLHYFYAQLRVSEKKYTEARNLLREALKLRDHPHYLVTLAQTYWETDEEDKAKDIIRSGAARHMEDFSITSNALMLDIDDWEISRAANTAKQIIESAKFTPYESAQVATILALCAYLQNDIELCNFALPLTQPLIDSAEARAMAARELPKILSIYASYISALLEWRKANPQTYNANTTGEVYIIGDSHCLSPAHTTISGQRAIPKLVFGAKAWHFAEADKFKAKKATLRKIIREIPQGSKVIFNFGEIDCRPDEGFFLQYLKDRSFDLEENIREAVGGYIAYTSKQAAKNKLDFTYAGIPAPNEEYVKSCGVKESDLATFLSIPRIFNQALKESGMPYIDTYAETLGSTGFAKEGVHIDRVHLKPDLLANSIKT